MNEVDQYALEEALAMRKELGGTITAVCVGDLTCQEVLYVAKAKGVNRAIRVNAPCANEVLIAEALAEVFRQLKPDLVLAGVESSDSMTGQTGILLAAMLGLPFAYAVTAIEARPNVGWVRVTKELGEGICQVLEIKLPAVLCVQSGIQPLKYTPPAKILQARKELLEVYSVPESSLQHSVVPQLRFTDVFKPQGIKRTQMLSGTSEDIAVALVKKIMEAR
ncbi:MAG: hypothetical protein HY670_02385 [Chloroflexi bacterium]|nr:hypothetical protein [Chloroflexota bacterium]